MITQQTEALLRQALEQLERFDPRANPQQPPFLYNVISLVDAIRSHLSKGEAEPSRDAETYLRGRYSAYRGHFAWRELEQAFDAGFAAAILKSMPHNTKLYAPAPPPASTPKEPT